MRSVIILRSREAGVTYIGIVRMRGIARVLSLLGHHCGIELWSVAEFWIDVLAWSAVLLLDMGGWISVDLNWGKWTSSAFCGAKEVLRGVVPLLTGAGGEIGCRHRAGIQAPSGWCSASD